MRKRTKAREFALQALYQIDITNSTISDMFDDFLKAQGVTGDVKDYCEKLVKGVVKRKGDIDTLISKCAKNWQLKRMAVVDRNILRLAAYELVHMKDIPHKVAINEAVEIAKRFGDEDSSKFVNGILDRLSREELKNADK